MVLQSIDRLFYGFYQLMTMQPWGGGDSVRASIVFGTCLAFNLITMLNLVAASIKFDYNRWLAVGVVYFAFLALCVVFLLLRYRRPAMLKRVLQAGNQRAASGAHDVRLALLYMLCSMVLGLAATSLAHEALFS